MKVMFWGAGGNTRIFLKMLEKNFSKKVVTTGIFDSFLNSIPFESNLPFYNTKKELFQLIQKSTHFIISIGGNGLARYEISKKLKSYGLEPVNLISDFAILDDIIKAGDGTCAMPGAIVHKFTEFGQQCIFNTNSTVDHECILGNGVHIMGGASIAGRVKIGDFCMIGTNATILPDISIGKGSYVGAGAVVTKNISEYEIVVGVPAKYMRKNNLNVDLSLFDE